MMIVLHTLKYGDTSLIVHGYTQEEGRVSFILRGAFRQANGKKGSSNHGTVLLHPLSIVNYVASKSPKGSMSYLKEFSPKYRLHSIREDFSKISIAMFISELLYRTLLHSERDGELYAFLEDAVLKLEAVEGSPANFHLWFLDRYTAFLGFPFERGFNLDADRQAPLHSRSVLRGCAVPADDRSGAEGTDRGRHPLAGVPYRLPYRPAFALRPASNIETPLNSSPFSVIITIFAR